MKSVSHIVKAALNGDGARSSKYDVLLVTKDGSASEDRYLGVLCKAASFPGISHNKIDFLYKGRPVPIRGQTTYEQTWSATFYLDENHEVKHVFDVWVLTLDERHSYVESSSPHYHRRERMSSHSSYTRDITIYQQSFDDTHSTAGYVLHNAFPIEVSAVDVSSEGAGEIATFTVTFSYTHWTPTNAPRNVIGSYTDNLAVAGFHDVSGLVGKAKHLSLASGPAGSNLVEGSSVPLDGTRGILQTNDISDIARKVTELQPKASVLEQANIRGRGLF